MGRFSTKKLAAVGVAAAVAVGGGIAAASIPGAGGVIEGCYAQHSLFNDAIGQSGRVRIIDTSVEACRGDETAISWNQAGQAGPPGAPGAPGAPGIQGPPGPAAPRLFVSMKPDGSVVASSGLSSDASATGRLGSGQYAATFNQSVANCAVTATSRQINPGLITPFFVKTYVQDAKVSFFLFKLDGSVADSGFDAIVTC